jgi:hypothetical protein
MPAMSSRFGLVYGPPIRKSPALPSVNVGDTVIMTVVDSAPLLALDAVTRQVDTLARFATGQRTQFKIAPGRISGPGTALAAIVPTGDAWAVMSDGSIAILHGVEYRLSWINLDGTRSESPPLPYPWSRLSDLDQQRVVDSANDAERVRYDDALAKGRLDSAAGRPYTVTGGHVGPTAKGSVAAQPPTHYDVSMVPDYVSPFRPGRQQLLADADNNIWIHLSRGVLTQPGSETYDVVNRQGQLIDRVRIPQGRELIAFGPGGTVYLLGHDGGKQFIERVRTK